MKTLLLTKPKFKTLSILLDEYEAFTLERIIRTKVLHFSTELRNSINEGEGRLDSPYWSKKIQHIQTELTRYQDIFNKLKQ